jgi:hypothetical protein
MGQLLVAVADMQSFVHDNWTSAQTRHSNMPTSENHWTRSQMRRSSMLAVHARPVPDKPEYEEDDAAVEICVRRKKLADAWKMMQECEAGIWTDVCNLYHMVVSAELDPETFAEDQSILDEVAEARCLMRNAEIISAVEAIKKYDQEEWKDIHASSYMATPWACKQIRRGSLTTVHEQHHEESIVDSKVRHAEHAHAWQIMKTCDCEAWAAACHHHEEYNEVEAVKRQKLDEAVAVIQEFNTGDWTGAHLRHKTLPASKPHWTATQIRHGATLAVHSLPVPEVEMEDPAHQTHIEKLNEAWKVMKDVGTTEWIKACKTHEDLSVINTASEATTLKTGSAFKTGGIIRT